MKKHTKILITALIVIGAIAAISPRFISTSLLEKRSATVIMHAFYDKLVDLKPILFDREKFFSNESSTQIKEALMDLQDTVRSAQKDSSFETPGYEITLSLLESHLDDTQRLYDNGYKEFSYELLSRTSDFCISCHTQIPAGPTPKLPEEKDLAVNFSQDAYRNADFFFATRRYDEATYIYDWLLQLYPQTVIQDKDLFEIYYKMLIIHSRVSRDPQLAAEALENSLDNPQLPVTIKNEVTQWVSYLRENAVELKSLEGLEFQTFLDKAMQKLEGHLGARTPPSSEPQAPELMWYSGLLYQHLFHASTKEQQATVLYLLAIAENMIKEPPVQSVSDLFLKKCVTEFAETKIAEKCKARAENSFLEH